MTVSMFNSVSTRWCWAAASPDSRPPWIWPNRDYKVAVVERDPSIVGGKMIRLSKVFPTLDCASCITTPKMAASAHHPEHHAFHVCAKSWKSAGQAGRFQARITCGKSPGYR